MKKTATISMLTAGKQLMQKEKQCLEDQLQDLKTEEDLKDLVRPNHTIAMAAADRGEHLYLMK